MHRGELGLELVHARGTSGRIVELGQAEHALEVRPVGLAHAFEALLAEVALVGQADAALLDEDEVPLGVARVVVDVELHESRDALALEAAERAEEVLDRPDQRHIDQLPRDRRRTEQVHVLLVHETRIEVADLAGLGSGFGLLGLLDDLAHGLLGLLVQHEEGAVAGLVGRDLGAFDPLAVDVPEEVVLRTHLLVEFIRRDA
ncbi:MAG: hypothetical protein K0S05_3386 [Agromyces sp.]|nr:hypothetical protein [Agromyces sp.]